MSSETDSEMTEAILDSWRKVGVRAGEAYNAFRQGWDAGAGSGRTDELEAPALVFVSLWEEDRQDKASRPASNRIS